MKNIGAGFGPMLPTRAEEPRLENLARAARAENVTADYSDTGSQDLYDR